MADRRVQPASPISEKSETLAGPLRLAGHGAKSSSAASSPSSTIAPG
jgi:hypothetical protein